ncbi:N-acetyltransferase 14 [Chelonia mydas]|uniref:N-acetyltransferase 14 n=1 Tax=Chelonia mydas TaxID=8469 RepID=M7C0B9_CHEMY|nr:N-acetyltransferase 14 [Chelonia mydas]
MAADQASGGGSPGILSQHAGKHGRNLALGGAFARALIAVPWVGAMSLPPPGIGARLVLSLLPDEMPMLDPSQLSIREMQEDEEQMVLELLKDGFKDTENRLILYVLTRPVVLLLLAVVSSGLRFLLNSFVAALLGPVLLTILALKLLLRRSPDLGGLGAYYRSGQRGLWVAVYGGDDVCGCVALQPHPQGANRTAELRRLAVSRCECVGRVEINYKGHWGSVCDDEWDLADAAVVCRQLGCGTALSAPVGAWFGEGSGPIWLNEVRCQGSEQHLRLCRHRGWRQHVCSHEEDASAVCSAHRFLPIITTEPSVQPALRDHSPPAQSTARPASTTPEHNELSHVRQRFAKPMAPQPRMQKPRMQKPRTQKSRTQKLRPRPRPPSAAREETQAPAQVSPQAVLPGTSSMGAPELENP